MSSNPVDHVKDIPYFAISENYSILFPKISGSGHEASVEWAGEPLHIFGSPAYFTVQTFSLLVVSALLLMGAIRAAGAVRLRPERGRGLGVRIFESLVQFIRDDVCRPNLGPHGRHYVPVLLTFFFLILFSNLWGLIPLVFTATATANINVTGALAVTILFLLFFLGMKEQGVSHFWKNLVPHGLPLLILPLMYPLEFIGPFAKCFALCIRLFANMVAGHVVIASLLALGFSADGSLGFGVVPAFLMSVAISCLEVFVAVLQAYIFTLLASIFLGAFIHPEH